MPRKRTIPRICQKCGADFLAWSLQVKAGGGLFCSLKCSARRDARPIILSDDGVTAMIPLIGRTGAIRGYAVIDADDAEWASQWQWHLTGGYASRDDRSKPQRRLVWLHRELLNLPRIHDGREGDHIDRDRLNDRRGNLRIISKSSNPQNTKPRGGTSPYRGVSWHKASGRWRATIGVCGKIHHLGTFSDEMEAAEAARAARVRLMPYAVD